MKEQSKALFAHAAKLKENGQYDEARNILLELLSGEPSAPSVRTVLADTCWDAGRIDEAISHFAIAVALVPSSETVSLGLFHCLIEADRRDEAFREMRRFLDIQSSEEYSKILATFNDPRGSDNSDAT